METKLPQINDNLKGASRAALMEMVAAYMDAIDDGELDPVEAFIFSYKLLEFATLLNSNLKPQIKGVKGEFYGLRISEAKVGSTYDFGACNSPRWKFLIDEMNKIKEGIEKEQAFLKSLPGTLQVVDEDTGECYELRPPVNSYSISPKIEWI